ncbi:MAG: glycosyltransferase family A protein, partial [Desulfovibrionaceae bacterium]
NNGSTDETATCLQSWKARWGSRLSIVTLPVNVGAAAARNWLAALPEVRALPFAAYVDDDVSLPPDWLRHLRRAVQVQPHASAWGCRIQDANTEQQQPRIQSGPLHLTLGFAPTGNTPPLPGQTHGPEAENAEVAFSPLRAHAEPFSVTTMPPACPDRGQWNYIRACASVTGCCHMFRTESLQTNHFSLSLSPSQYDDLEHDLRALRQGHLACYTGFCAGLHARKSGQAAEGMSPSAFGSALGNKYKMHGLFSPEDITAMAHTEYADLEEDLLQKLSFIDATA